MLLTFKLDVRFALALNWLTCLSSRLFLAVSLGDSRAELKQDFPNCGSFLFELLVRKTSEKCRSTTKDNPKGCNSSMCWLVDQQAFLEH